MSRFDARYYCLFPIQIWALAVSSGTEKLATGGGDSVVNMWTDCTVDDEEEAIRQEVQVVIRFCEVFLMVLSGFLHYM